MTKATLQRHNQRWLQRYKDDEAKFAETQLGSYFETQVQRLSQLPPTHRFWRQLQFIEEANAFVSTSTRAEHDAARTRTIQWIVFRGFEETMTAQGRSTIQWRHFPPERPELRQHAEEQGLLFLLAREYLAITTAQGQVQRTESAVQLATQWLQDKELPAEHDLDTIMLSVWFRRCLDATRQMSRVHERQQAELGTQACHSHHSTESKDATPLWSLPALSSEQRLTQAENSVMLHLMAREVARDEVDRMLYAERLQGKTEQALQQELGLTHGQLRGRWTSLIERIQLLFQMYGQASAHPSLVEMDTLTATTLTHALTRQALSTKQRNVTVEFWVALQALSVILEKDRKKSQQPHQNTAWPALSKMWRRSIEVLLDPPAPSDVSTPPLFKSLFFFWYRAQRAQPATHMTLAQPPQTDPSTTPSVL